MRSVAKLNCLALLCKPNIGILGDSTYDPECQGSYSLNNVIHHYKASVSVTLHKMFTGIQN